MLRKKVRVRHWVCGRREARLGGQMLWLGLVSCSPPSSSHWHVFARAILSHHSPITLPRLLPSLFIKSYLEWIFKHTAFKKTCNTEQLYLDSYKWCISFVPMHAWAGCWILIVLIRWWIVTFRYVYNQPNTSQLWMLLTQEVGFPRECLLLTGIWRQPVSIVLWYIIEVKPLETCCIWFSFFCT